MNKHKVLLTNGDQQDVLNNYIFKPDIDLINH